MENQELLHQITEATGGVGAVLITGRSQAKTELVKHIDRHDPQLIERIARIETIDHPTDGALVAHTRQHFKAADRVRP